MLSVPKKSQLKHSLLLALPFQLSWFVGAFLVHLSGGSVAISLLFLLIPVLWIPAALELITQVRVPSALQLHFSLFITLSSVAGSSFGFYGLFLNWDTWVHAYSGAVLAWLGFLGVQTVETKLNSTLPRWFVAAVGLTTSLAFAALWEISEFTSDVFLHTATQSGGLEDTIIDMIGGGVGAIITIVIGAWLKIPKSLLPRSFTST